MISEDGLKPKPNHNPNPKSNTKPNTKKETLKKRTFQIQTTKFPKPTAPRATTQPTVPDGNLFQTT